MNTFTRIIRAFNSTTRKPEKPSCLWNFHWNFPSVSSPLHVVLLSAAGERKLLHLLRSGDSGPHLTYFLRLTKKTQKLMISLVIRAKNAIAQGSTSKIVAIHIAGVDSKALPGIALFLYRLSWKSWSGPS